MSSLTTRRRSKGDPNVRTVECHTDCYSPNGRLSWSANNNGTIPPAEFSYIEDEVGGITSRALHDCINVTYQSKMVEGTHIGIAPNGDKYLSYPAGNMLIYCSEWRNRLSPKYIAPSDSELDEFNRRAIDAMMPKIELTMDLPTFITEMTSLPDLFKSGLVSKLLSKTKKFKRKLSKYQTLGTETALAGDYLNWQFGWLPTIADAKALYSDFRNLEDKLDRLLSGQNKVFTSHYTEVINIDPSVFVEESGGSYSVEYSQGSLSIALTATMRYRYVLKDIQGKSREALLFRARLDSLGFNNPLRTIWERVPFSFMLDWFIPVGDFLEQFRKRWIDSTVEISEYSISYKFVEPLQTKITFVDDLQGRWECCSTSLSCYNRRRFLPNYDKFGLRINERFGSKQLMLSGALASTFFGKK